MSNLPWVLIVIVILAIIFLILVLKRKDLMKQPTNYKTFFILGIIFFVLGLATDSPPFWILGIAYFAISLANKNKWGKKLKPTKKEIQIKRILVLGLLILLILGLVVSIFVNENPQVTNFEECVAAGNPVMESFPRQCRHNDDLFVEIINWKNDGVELRQHSIDGTLGCFGCNLPGDGPALCIDPIPEMQAIPETPDRYCNNNFEIVEIY